MGLLPHDYSRLKEVTEESLEFSTAYRRTVCIVQSRSLCERTLLLIILQFRYGPYMIGCQPNDQLDIKRIQMVTTRPLEQITTSGFAYWGKACTTTEKPQIL